MGKETSNRIQTSILNGAEKRTLVGLAERQPAWMTSDILTGIGLVGGAVCALGFILAISSLPAIGAVMSSRLLSPLSLRC